MLRLVNPDVENMASNAGDPSSSYFGSTSNDYSKERIDQMKSEFTVRMKPTHAIVPFLATDLLSYSLCLPFVSLVFDFLSK